MADRQSDRQKRRAGERQKDGRATDKKTGERATKRRANERMGRVSEISQTLSTFPLIKFDL